MKTKQQILKETNIINEKVYEDKRTVTEKDLLPAAEHDPQLQNLAQDIDTSSEEYVEEAYNPLVRKESSNVQNAAQTPDDKFSLTGLFHSWQTNNNNTSLGLSEKAGWESGDATPISPISSWSNESSVSSPNEPNEEEILDDINSSDEEGDLHDEIIHPDQEESVEFQKVGLETEVLGDSTL